MTARIYVSCLHSYNAGHLHGRWIDASPDPDEMFEEIRRLLDESPVAFDHADPSPKLAAAHSPGNALAIARWNARRSFAAGRSKLKPCTEEWAIHDVDGLPRVGEYTSLAEIAAIAELIEEHGDGARAALELSSGDVEQAREYLDAYCGDWDDEEEYAWQLLEDTGMLAELPEWAQPHFDVAGYARDLFCSGYSSCRYSGRLHVFSI